MEQVERQFPDELVVIGVHSPKYPAEKASESLRSAIQREEVEHPVINDAEMEVWSSYSVRAWPTLMFLDPQGRVIGKHEGEAPAEALAEVVERLIAEYEQEGLIDRSPIPSIKAMAPPQTTLAFPSKVLADQDNNRLYIADSGHHRIIVTGLDGSEPRIIGSGEAGLMDGDFSMAQFHHPQGMALDGDNLYVADTRNHAIRRIDLSTTQVQTLAGTGELGHGYSKGGPALETNLRSPWDVALHGRTLYISMAGTHQLWLLDLDTGQLGIYAGTGHEGIRDGEVGGRAWLAQPSGIKTDGSALYFSDSETSAIRSADLPPGKLVRTFVGTGLFDFGDVDEIGDQARLQHPLDVEIGDGILYVADSYNHKIKRLHPETRHVESWLGSGQAGDADGQGSAARFREPAGLALTGDRLYIADTNNHVIRVADIRTGNVTTLEIKM